MSTTLINCNLGVANIAARLEYSHRQLDCTAELPRQGAASAPRCIVNKCQAGFGGFVHSGLSHKSGQATKVGEQPLPECTATAPDHPPQEATSPPGATNVHWGHKVAPLPSQQCSQVMCILPQHWYLSIYLSPLEIFKSISLGKPMQSCK